MREMWRQYRAVVKSVGFHGTPVENLRLSVSVVRHIVCPDECLLLATG
jgi:hypothetical protein